MKLLPVFIVFIIFLIAGLMATFLSFQDISPETIAKGIAGKLKAELIHIDKDASLILERSSERNIEDLHEKAEHSFFIYNHEELVSWTDNHFVPLFQSVQDDFVIKLLKTSTGEYLVKKWKIDAGGFLLAVIPLHTEFKIRNDFLQPQWNKEVFSQDDVSIFETASALGTPVSVNGVQVFKISILSDKYLLHDKNRMAAVIFLFLSVTCFCLGLNIQLKRIKSKNVLAGFIFLSATLILLRLVMVQFNFPANLIHTELFDPKNFASSNYNSSLGDLLLNEILLLVICHYCFKNRNDFKFDALKNKIFDQSIVIPFISGLSFLFAWLYPFVVIQTLFNNSSISLDISQSLNFSLIRIVSLVIILISWFCSFFFAHIFLPRIVSTVSWRTILSALMSIVVFVLINEYSNQVYFSSLAIGVFYFLLVYFLKLHASISKLSYKTFVYLFCSIFCFSINDARCIQYFGENEKIENQFRFANNFLIERDNFGEYLLHETSRKVANDAFVKIRMNSPFFSKDAIRQKIRQVFLPSYFNKYDVEIFLFNPDGSSYDDHTSASFSELISVYDKEAFNTEYKDVHFINSPSADITQKYLVIIPVNRFKINTGYIVIELSLKKIIPDSVYPELLVDNRFQQFYKTQDLSYALFSSKSIVFSSGDFNYEGKFDRSWLGQTDLYKQGIEESGYVHIAEEDDIGRAAVVSSKLPSISYLISNFSFHLVLGLTVLLFLFLGLGVANYFRGEKLIFAARIQLFLNLAFFIPLIAASIITLGLTSQASKKQLEDENLNKSKVFAEQITGSLDSYLGSGNENEIDIENQLTDLAKLTNLDANVYDLNGRLMATSQPQIFENGLLSGLIDARALHKMNKGETLFIERERVGLLDYFVSYAALKSPVSGKVIGMLAVPFFQSVNSIERAQITIFANILNIFAGIFIILLFLSYLVSEWLTFPLKFITNSLSKTSLDQTNQPLTWNANDEIGLMVREYNQMLFKLSESKVELEQTQRERAWREMAQQVAHEIKNPLTPMKLTLQQLERGVRNGINSEEKTEKAISSLLIQVDTLNDIASSFSSFAKMPEPVMRSLDLISLLKRIIDLHNQSNELLLKSKDKSLFVQGDEQLLGRTFSNIVLNAKQSFRTSVKGSVEISIKVESNKCKISFKDNGSGIDGDHIDRVFLPHFSTKKSGSGLGLAIARQAIEQMNGRIWFETKVGSGTTFFIELMLST